MRSDRFKHWRRRLKYRWSGPEGTTWIYSHSLARGDLIAYQHRLWHVVTVERSGRHDRPWRVIIRPHDQSMEWTATDNDMSLACAEHWEWHVYPESTHYPVCADCDGPWPCKELHIQDQIERDIKQAERYSIPGVCPACSEPVTQRQLRQTWPLNLYALNRDQPVTFHLRRQCEAGAIEYDREVMLAGMPSQLGRRLNDPRSFSILDDKETGPETD